MIGRASERRIVHGVYAAFGAAILMAILVKGLVAPQLADLRAKRAEAEDLERSVSDLRERIARFRAQAAGAEPAIPHAVTAAGGTGAIVEELSRRHESRTCTIGRVAFELPLSGGEGTGEVPFEFEVVARYGEIVDLLERLEAGDPIVHVRDVWLVSVPEKGFSAHARLAGALYVIP